MSGRHVFAVGIVQISVLIGRKQASMTDITTAPTQTDDTSRQASAWMSELGTLLEQFELVAHEIGVDAPVVSPQTDNQLAQVRLGIAGSLYTALRAKHAATATHALRVALVNSAWAVSMSLPEGLRDTVELAALLHDVGVIGVPDQVLLKPGPLDQNEMRLIEQSRAVSLDILRNCSADPTVLEIVSNVGTWYDGFKGGSSAVGKEIPLGARMITIVEAFDAMTTDHVFRPAMSQERAIQELFEYSGSQFDPELVKSFVELHVSDQSKLRLEVASRWLNDLDPETVNSYWKLNSRSPDREGPSAADMFQARLLDNMHDAVVFIDAGMRVVQWNNGAERLTGIAESTVVQRQWASTLLDIHNEKGDLLSGDDCPVSCAIHSGVQSLRRLEIRGRNGRLTSVDSHTIPVVADDGTVLGAIVLMHDASPETSLEQRCQNLHEKATKDPLTQVANRAEFDRVHSAFIKHHREQHVPCSLIICDLDHFKKVNDTYGHQAGDDAIKSLATLLKNHCRPGDLVARYGGEEFVMLCADCRNASATSRADTIRVALSQLIHPKMPGRSITASFGVTEVQPGDTAETMLRRADRGLLKAKAKGRNVVVQLGSGARDEKKTDKKGFWARKAEGPAVVLKRELTTPVPIKMAIEKLRGFVADHQAKINSIEGTTVKMEIDDSAGPNRRRNDRPVPFLVELDFEEQQTANRRNPGENVGTHSRTRIRLTIAPRKSRDRRRDDVADRAREVLASFRSYLMATEEKAQPEAESSTPRKGVLGHARSIFTPWRSKR